MTDHESDERPSKSARKRESDDLQALGEALIDLPENEFDALLLPENLRDAVLLARRITAHGGLYRQKQYIGKLMRKIDAEPIRAAMQARRDRERAATVRFRRLEQWRERIIREGRPALDELARELDPSPEPTLLTELETLAVQAAREQRDKRTPHASRELFRKLRQAMGEADSG